MFPASSLIRNSSVALSLRWMWDQINRYTWKNIHVFRSCRGFAEPECWFCWRWALTHVWRCACSHLHPCSCCASSAACGCRCLNVSLLSEWGEVVCVETVAYSCKWLDLSFLQAGGDAQDSPTLKALVIHLMTHRHTKLFLPLWEGVSGQGARRKWERIKGEF